MKADPEYYLRLTKERAMHNRWFGISLAVAGICAIMAFHNGPSSGWPWLIGLICSLFYAIWARIDFVRVDLEIAIYLASPKEPDERADNW